MSNEIDNNWILKSVEIEFKKDWSHEKDPAQKVDRYEGKICFQNGDNESFSFKIKPHLAQKYIDLMAETIVDSANNLGNRLIDSLGLNK